MQEAGRAGEEYFLTLLESLLRGKGALDLPALLEQVSLKSNWHCGLGLGSVTRTCIGSCCSFSRNNKKLCLFLAVVKFVFMMKVHINPMLALVIFPLKRGRGVGENRPNVCALWGTSDPHPGM